MTLTDVLEKDELILYHGSRGGIVDEIKPISRIRCDFGKGFYMGTNPEQVKGLVVEDTSPVFYTLRLKLSEIDPDDILVLEEKDWVYAVLANRGKVDDFNDLEIAKNILEKCKNYDFIIGAIADDRLNEAMRRFADNGLTDEGLSACLNHVDYGFQVVAKTEKACKMIEIISERDFNENEIEGIRKYVKEKRDEGKAVVKKMAREYLRKGKYLSEIIDIESKIVNMDKKGFSL